MSSQVLRSSLNENLEKESKTLSIQYLSCIKNSVDKLMLSLNWIHNLTLY